MTAVSPQSPARQATARGNKYFFMLLNIFVDECEIFFLSSHFLIVNVSEESKFSAYLFSVEVKSDPNLGVKME